MSYDRGDRVVHVQHRTLTGTVAGRPNAADEVFVTWDYTVAEVGSASWVGVQELLWLPMDMPR